MCTIMTMDRSSFGAAVERQIWEDSARNDDGWALLLVDRIGLSTSLRTMDLDLVLGMLRTNTRWERFFLHARMATQGRAVVENTHGWCVRGVWWMHNGVLSNHEARAHAVDSMLIGEWLKRGGVDHALTNLMTESFANVLLFDSRDGYYYVSRSSAGTLYTDGHGNYSTHPVNDVALVVDPWTQDVHELQRASYKQCGVGT